MLVMMSNVPAGLLHNGQCRVGRFTDSDDELCLICLVNFNDVIYCLSEAQEIDPWYISCNYYHKSNNC